MMGCNLPEAQLWSWIDREAAELDPHLQDCELCRRRADRIREDIRRISADLSEVVPLPEKIGPYKINGLLGEGGQALVYEAEQESPRRPIALKVLRGGRFAGKKHIQHFLRETQTLASLHHPAIATIFEAGRTEDGLHYFAMELVRGRPLHLYLQDHNPDRKARFVLFRKICQAVQYAHDHAVIHRDLKPSNILVTDQGEPKILDFGLARLTHPDPDFPISLTRTGQMSGTPRYMSPEQVKGRKADIGPRSDVYSLGVILYELLTGKPPHEGSSFTPETVMAICEEEPVPPSQVDASVKGDLETIVLKALTKNQDRRYASAADLGEDLRRFMDHEPILARRPSRFYIWRKAILRHRTAALLGSVALVALLIWGWQALQPDYDKDEARIRLLEMRYQLFLANPPSRINRHLALGAPEKYPGLLEADLVKALALTATGEKGVALKFLGDKFAQDPGQWLYRALRSEIGLVKDPDVAREFLVWAQADADRSLAESWYLRTFTTLEPKQALTWAHIALTHEPNHLLALEAVARFGAVTGDLELSLMATTHLLDQNESRRSQWLSLKSTLLCRLGQPQEALTEIDKLVVENPTEPRFHIARGQIHRWLENYEAAVDDYSRAIELAEAKGQSTTWYYYHRGTPLWILGRLEEAAADFRQAYRLLARASFGNVRLVLVLYELGLPHEAEAALADARQHTGSDIWLARILACLAGEVTPKQLVVGAESEDPQRLCEAYYYAGEIDLHQGRPRAAVGMFSACVNVGTTIDRGNFHDRLSEYELAQWRLSQLVPSD